MKNKPLKIVLIVILVVFIISLVLNINDFIEGFNAGLKGD
ncbi:hypothetical protein SAMN06297358_3574 [Pedobacter xixiisoli]|uniref:Uncharacterized protein n=1 Tax=Pedobacter xixiisoli TaxID=1476464 RepID=A0A286ADE6_9SPHI|nr:hypothetical protein SAMN06297358_3574 [Pedobacter xixiisoli]